MLKLILLLFIISGCALRIPNEQIYRGCICKQDDCVGLSVDETLNVIDNLSNFKRTPLPLKEENQFPMFEIVLTGKSASSYFELDTLLILNEFELITSSDIHYSAKIPLDLNDFDSYFEK